MDALVLYYTRSQNTAQLAKAAQAAIGECGWQVACMPLDKAEKRFPKTLPSLIILGSPVQYWTVPTAAMEYIKKLPNLTGCPAFVYSCYGGCVTNNVPYTLAKELTAKGATAIGGAQLLTPHSCRIDGKKRLGDVEKIFGKGLPDEHMLAEFKEAVTRVVRFVEKGTASPLAMDRLKIHTKGHLAAVMSPVSPLKLKRRFMPPVVVNPSACQGCGECLKVCDTNSIQFDANQTATINQKTCYRCYGCMEVCPNQALGTNWKQAQLRVRSMGWLAKDMKKSVFVFCEEK
jgi:ferredoxin/flavodoxin